MEKILFAGTGQKSILSTTEIAKVMASKDSIIKIEVNYDEYKINKTDLI